MVEEATGRKAKFAAMSFTIHQGTTLVITPVGLKILGLAQWGLFSYISKVILTFRVHVEFFALCTTTISLRDFYEKTKRKN